ncbi:MAG: ABC transporter substrate-binding protein [Candidatus Pacebacteria bacterium]|nr:ABC transporter substrate-binding protein [Candidatus Paceibacterota bacterium]
MYKKTIYVSLALLVLVWGIYEVGDFKHNNQISSQINPNQIKIGVVLPITGNFAGISEDIQNAIALAQEKVGNSVSIWIEDSASEPQKGISAIQNLIQNKKVQAVITGPGSTVNIAMSAVSERSKVPFFAISATPMLMGKDDFALTLQPSITREVTRMSEFLASRSSMYGEKLNKVAVIYDSGSDTLTTGTKQFAEDFTSRGGVVVDTEGYKKDVEYNTIVTKVLSSKPDSIYVLGVDKTAGPVIKSIRELGFKGLVAGFSGIDSDEFLKITKGVNEGVVVTAVPFSCESNSATEQYCKEYKAKFNGREPQQYGAYAYDLINKLSNNYKTCSSKIGEGLKECVLKGDTASVTLTGYFGFDQNGDLSKEVPIYVKEVRGSKFEIVK